MSKATIEILGQSYKIPEMSASLKPIQKTIQQNVAIVRTGQIPGQKVKKVVKEGGFLGLWQSEREVIEDIPARELTVEERFKVLGHLVTHYDEMLRELTTNKEKYTDFLAQLEEGSLNVVRRGLDKQRAMIPRLLEQAERIRAKGKMDLLQKNLEQQAHVKDAVRLTIQAGLLIMSKIDVCRKGITALVEDQNTQLNLLAELREELGLTLEVYMMGKEVEAIVKDAQALAQVAIEFESYLEAYMGPLHSLLSEVGRVDENVAEALEQVESLTASLELGSLTRVSALDAGYEPVLDLLVNGNLRQDQITRLVDDVRGKNIEDVAIDAELLAGEGNIEQAITNATMFFSKPAKTPSRQTRSIEIQSVQINDSGPQEPLQPGRDNFILVSAGTFLMGSKKGRGLIRERPLREVELTHSFWIGPTQVTQDEWEAVMGNNPSYFRGGRRPVEQINWYEAIAYCNERSRQEGLDECYEVGPVKRYSTGQNKGWIGDGSGQFSFEWVRWKGYGFSGYRLPTEAEWEMAARAGTDLDYAGSNNPDEVGWYRESPSEGTHKVGLKKCNDWGMYDMSGNVLEWCWDWYGEEYYASAPKRNPMGPKRGSYRVARGGSWNHYADGLRAACRNGFSPSKAKKFLGFRCVRVN